MHSTQRYCPRYSRVVKLWSHQSVRQRYALRSSAVRATITTGGATNVLMLRNTLNVRTMIPSRFSRLASVIFTAFADFTRKITDILQAKRKRISSDPFFYLIDWILVLFLFFLFFLTDWAFAVRWENLWV